MSGLVCYTLKNGNRRKILKVIEFDAVDVWGNGTHQPVNHLTWIHSEGSEDTNNTITKDGSRECCKYGSCGANFRIVEELKTVRPLMSHPMLRNSEESYTLHGEIVDGRAAIRSTRSNYTSNDVLEDLGTKAWRGAHGYEHERRTSLSLNLPGLTKCRAGPSRSNRVPSTLERVGRKVDHKIPNE
jgi:hypothetical protein